LAIAIGIIKSLGNTVSNNYTLVVVVAYATACWVVLALPWFYFEQPREGQKVPDGLNIITVGIRQAIIAAREVYKLRQTLLYLMGYWIAFEVMNTNVQNNTTGINDRPLYFRLFRIRLLSMIRLRRCTCLWQILPDKQLELVYQLGIK
jgi:Vacuole effluxer Atg22 like